MDFAPCFWRAPALDILLQLGLETAQLLLTLPLGPLPLQPRFRAPNTRILIGMGHRRVDVLPVLKLVLPLLLSDLHPLALLALSCLGRRRLQTSLLLQHTKLQRVLPLLPQHLLLVQRPCSRVLRPPHHTR